MSATRGNERGVEQRGAVVRDGPHGAMNDPSELKVCPGGGFFSRQRYDEFGNKATTFQMWLGFYALLGAIYLVVVAIIALGLASNGRESFAVILGTVVMASVFMVYMYGGVYATVRRQSTMLQFWIVFQVCFMVVVSLILLMSIYQLVIDDSSALTVVDIITACISLPIQSFLVFQSYGLHKILRRDRLELVRARQLQEQEYNYADARNGDDSDDESSYSSYVRKPKKKNKSKPKKKPTKSRAKPKRREPSTESEYDVSSVY